VHAHKHLSLSGVIEWCPVSVVHDGVVMPVIMLGMNNVKLWHYVGLFGVIEVVVTDVFLILPQSTADSWHKKPASARTCDI